jgi:hypothetical protein
MFRPFLIALMLACVTDHVLADIIVTVQSGTIAEGGTGYVDVYARSSSTDSFSVTSYHLKIEEETTGTTAGSLIFREDINQSAAQQTITSPVPYVLQSDTDNGNWSAARQDPLEDEIIGGDSTLSLNDVQLTTADMLLARLYLQHSVATPGDAVGDRWVIRLMNDPFTYFEDSSSANPTIDLASYSTVGTFTVVSAVPEPAAGLACAVVIAVLARRCRRTRGLQN